MLVLISKALKSTYINAKQVAKTAGHLISKTPAIGPLTRLFTRQMYRFVENRTSWYNPEVSDNLLKHELLFWERNLINNNGFRIKQNYLTTKVIYILMLANPVMADIL